MFDMVQSIKETEELLKVTCRYVEQRNTKRGLYLYVRCRHKKVSGSDYCEEHSKGAVHV
jgi:hypothetical protein